MGVTMIFADHWISDQRGTDSEGRKQFTLHDSFTQTDLVAYPSEYEGFGNAFLEALYYKKPVVCNRYAIYRTDIEPLGFETICFDGFLTDEVIKRTRRILENSAERERMVEHNYKIANRFFDYDVLRDEFEILLRRPHNIYRSYGRNPNFDRRAAFVERFLEKRRGG